MNKKENASRAYKIFTTIMMAVWIIMAVYYSIKLNLCMAQISMLWCAVFSILYRLESIESDIDALFAIHELEDNDKE